MKNKNRRSFLAGMGGLALGSVASPLVRADKKSTSVKRHALSIHGEVFQRDDQQYEQSRLNAVWQAIKPARYPELIVKAANEDDIISTLHYARQRGMPVAVRGSGHNYIASYLREGGILLNVSGLRDLQIDADSYMAQIQPGISGAAFSAILGEQGLAFPVAHGPSVAMGGYLLGGGMGWNGEHWNRFACFNVDAIELITATGEKLKVNRDNHPDLFWAARGAGPAFCAVVTRYHLKVFPLPRAITVNTYVCSIDQIENIAAWLEEARHRQDSKIELSFILESGGGEQQCILSAVCFADTEDEARALLGKLVKDFPETGRLVSSEYQPRSFAEVLGMTRTSTPVRLANETAWTQEPAAALKAMIRHFHHSPRGKTVIIANYRSNTVLPEEAAFSRNGPLFLNWSTRWPTPSGDSEHMQWMDEVAASLEPLMSGCYVNESDFLRRPHWSRFCYAEPNRLRLAGINTRYDPDGTLPSAIDLHG